MGAVLVDSNVLIDVLGGGEWAGWSGEALERAGEGSVLVINPIIYGELAPGFDRMSELDDALPPSLFERAPLPWAASFLAAKVHGEYRRRGGRRERVLADYLIGAHALVAGMALLTRDGRRYRRDFPALELIAPE